MHEYPQAPYHNTFCRLQPRPTSDDGYLEQLTKALFRSGFSWTVVEDKWPNFVSAFDAFAVDTVSAYDDAQINRLLQDKGIVRNRRKIVWTIENAKRIGALRAEFGSFGRFIDAHRGQGEQALAKQVVKQFAGLGDSMVVSFLRSVGEEIPQMTEHWMKRRAEEPNNQQERRTP